MKAGSGGFTFLEVLVSTALFAILGALAYSGLTGMLDRREAATQVTERFREVQRGWFVLNRDFSLAASRPVREAALGSTEGALLANDQSLAAVLLTQAARTNPGQLPRSNLQRVGYRVENGELIRMAWPVLDQAQDSVAREAVLLSGVNELRLQFMDDQGQWHSQWPPANIPFLVPEAYLPVAVQIALEFEDIGTIERTIEIAVINQ